MSMAYRPNRTDGDGKRSMGSGTEGKRLATREFTRRRFLGMSAGLGAGLFVLGAVLATYFKFRDPRRYDLIGRIVFEDSVVRD